MIASGNGKRERCALNLIKTIRGEVPYERMKGISRHVIDAPSIDVNRVKADVSWVIRTYEKRIVEHSVEITGDGAIQGSFGISLNIK